MPNRSFNVGDYRFGFNGKEADRDGGWGSLNHYDYGFRIYNPGIARFLSVDPLRREYPELTPYQFASNSPIANIDLDGLERYWAADGAYLGKYGESIKMMIVTNIEMANRAQNALENHKLENLTFFEKDLPNSSTRAYEATDKNEVNLLRNWAKQYRNGKREYAMSLFTKFIENDGGPGYFPVIVEGSLAEGPPWEPGENATVDPELSKGPVSWFRSTTIHTHPRSSDKFNDHSNKPPRTFSSGGDIQWAISKNVKLYMVPLDGPYMGVFDPNDFTDYVRERMAKANKEYKDDLMRLHGGLYHVDNPYKFDFLKGTKGKGFWLFPDEHQGRVKSMIKGVEIDP